MTKKEHFPNFICDLPSLRLLSHVMASNITLLSPKTDFTLHQVTANLSIHSSRFTCPFIVRIVHSLLLDILVHLSINRRPHLKSQQRSSHCSKFQTIRITLRCSRHNAALSYAHGPTDPFLKKEPFDTMRIFPLPKQCSSMTNLTLFAIQFLWEDFYAPFFCIVRNFNGQRIRLWQVHSLCEFNNNE